MRMVDINNLPEGYKPALPNNQLNLQGPITASPIDIPIKNVYQRTSLPPISAGPDSLRYFYAGDQVPQHRVLSITPEFLIHGNISTGTETTVNSTTLLAELQSGINSSINTSINSAIKSGKISGAAKLSNASITTPVLNVNQAFKSTILLAKSFLLVNLTVSVFSRVELYATASAQNGDIGRPTNVLPASTNTQGIISDVVILVNPKQWEYVNTTGSNKDTIQSNVVYITITNFSTGNAAVTASIQFVSMEA